MDTTTDLFEPCETRIVKNKIQRDREIERERGSKRWMEIFRREEREPNVPLLRLPLCMRDNDVIITEKHLLWAIYRGDGVHP